MFVATETALAAETAGMSLKRTAGATFHQLEDMASQQTRTERQITAKIKEAVNEANEITTLLKYDGFK